MPGPQEGSVIQQNVGDIFRLFREAEGMTQKQAGAFIGTTQAQVNYLERGKGNLKLDTLVKYAAAYGYDIEIVFKALEGDTRESGEGFCSNCPDHEGCSQGIPCTVAKSAANNQI